MPWTRDRWVIIVARKRHERALFSEQLETARAKLIVETLQIIVPQLIHGNGDDQLRAFSGMAGKSQTAGDNHEGDELFANHNGGQKIWRDTQVLEGDEGIK